MAVVDPAAGNTVDPLFFVLTNNCWSARSNWLAT